MDRLKNVMLEEMGEGRVALGLGIGVLPSSAISLIAADSGYSWLFLDLEHSPLSVRDVAEMSMTALGMNLATIVRLGREAIEDGSRVLDNGATGIVMPRVHTAADARRLVDLSKYAPIGNRSWGGPSPHLGFPPRPAAELMSAANDATLAVALIESVEGVANAEAITATEGIDAIFIGAIDLSVEMGLSGNVADPKIVEAIAGCVAAARRNGVFVGLGGVFGSELLAPYRRMGFDFVLAGIDYRLLNDAIRSRAASVRQDWAQP